LAWAPTKDAASGDMPRGGACSLRSGDLRMAIATAGEEPAVLRKAVDLMKPRVLSGNPPNGNILVGGGKETNMGFPE